MSYLFPFQSRKGVSGLEYMAVAILVMSGILLGGPYIMRSINAPFKAIEDGALDSARENLRQAPAGAVVLPPCNCVLTDVGCGNGAPCARTQKVFKYLCNPLGCEAQALAQGIIPFISKCEDDLTNVCCLNSVPTGNCAALAANIPGGCPPGQMERSQVCGSPAPVTNYFCQPDNACLVNCQPHGPNVIGWCDPSFEVGVIGSTPARLVEFGHCNDDLDMKCKAECRRTFVSVGAACVCPLNATDVGGICACNPGFVSNNNNICPVGQCFAGACGGGQCSRVW